jgi:hypothetical protein
VAIVTPSREHPSVKLTTSTRKTTCARCGRPIAEGDGLVIVYDGSIAESRHPECPTPIDPHLSPIFKKEFGR